jgi:hypothetical protein
VRIAVHDEALVLGGHAPGAGHEREVGRLDQRGERCLLLGRGAIFEESCACGSELGPIELNRRRHTHGRAEAGIAAVSARVRARVGIVVMRRRVRLRAAVVARVRRLVRRSVIIVAMHRAGLGREGRFATAEAHGEPHQRECAVRSSAHDGRSIDQTRAAVTVRKRPTVLA